jgi:carboxylesterase
LLLFRSAVDHVVEPVNARIILDGVPATDVQEVVLPDSYHVATLDNDAPTIFDGSVEFVRRICQQRAGQPVAQPREGT